MEIRTRLTGLLLALFSLCIVSPALASDAKPGGNLFIYNWSDYIAEDTIAQFEAETGIKVTYDVFDSNEVLEAKLLAGSTGYDLVVPSLEFLGRQIPARVFQPIDRAKLSNYGNLDPKLLERIAENDAGNRYAVPYLWGTTGIGYNVGKIAELFGEDFEVDSWDLVFNPEYASKIAQCGLTMLDSAFEMIPVALNYIDEDPNSFDPKAIEKAQAVLMPVRPHVRYFHSSQYISDLANGDICVAVGWSGDVFQAMDRAEEAERGVEVDYAIPEEGAPIWFDMLAIPADARNVDNAHLFIDYLLRPEVMASITDYVAYANPVPASREFMDEEIRDNPDIYPPEEVMERLFGLKTKPRAVDRTYTRIWTRVRTGR
jgi:putrescine transport system substrate-binding protein